MNKKRDGDNLFGGDLATIMMLVGKDAAIP
jgi:hypothetical protein